MIYLKSRKLLFIKPLKTASTSLEIALSCNATADDVVTPISLSSELLRLKMKGQLAINYLDNSSDINYRKKILLIEKFCERFPNIKPENFDKFFKLLYKSRGKRVFYNHIKPEEIARSQGEEFLKDSFIVTMCRHPYEVLVSRIYWEKWKKQRVSEFDMKSEIDKMLEAPALNYDYYFYQEKYLPNFVIRYEHLNDDLRELEKKFNLKLIENMPLTKNDVRSSKKPAYEVLTDEQKELCYAKNKRIFEYFSYEK
jgi:hypothetical protein